MKVKKCANKIKALNKKKGVLGFLFLLMSVSLMSQTNVDSLLNVLDEELIRSAHYETVKKQRIALIKENALKHNISLEEDIVLIICYLKNMKLIFVTLPDIMSI